MTEIVASRRSLITGLVSLLAAPAIVRFESIMPVRALPADVHSFNVLINWRLVGFGGPVTLGPEVDTHRLLVAMGIDPNAHLRRADRAAGEPRARPLSDEDIQAFARARGMMRP